MSSIKVELRVDGATENEPLEEPYIGLRVPSRGLGAISIAFPMPEGVAGGFSGSGFLPAPLLK
jgi:hypothetical protein